MLTEGVETSEYVFVPLRKFKTSSLRILPFGPVPSRRCKSIEFSLAIFLTAGVVRTGPDDARVAGGVVAVVVVVGCGAGVEATAGLCEEVAEECADFELVS